MARLPQIRGLLLEEIALYLLGVNGYVPIDAPGDDRTLSLGPSGMEVCGRGCNHQIDAIADYRMSPPFSNPQRLLVEAKSLRKRVGVDVVRNAVGVLKDVSENWIGKEESRYHYQYAIFSDTDFSERAQRYAFAHDVYLLPLRNAAFFRPVLDILRSLVPEDFGADASEDIRIDMADLRRTVRTSLRDVPTAGGVPARVLQLVEAGRHVHRGVIAVAMKQLPLFLVPAPGVLIEMLPDRIAARIRWDDDSWYVDGIDDRRLFSFDLPEALFKKYASEGVLSRRGAIALKQDALATLQATVFDGDRGRLMAFELDMGWMQEVTRRIDRQRDERE